MFGEVKDRRRERCQEVPLEKKDRLSREAYLAKLDGMSYGRYKGLIFERQNRLETVKQGRYKRGQVCSVCGQEYQRLRGSWPNECSDVCHNRAVYYKETAARRVATV